MTNSWILSKGYVFANHQLIESALLQSKTTPAVVVVDDPTNYVAAWWNPEEKAAKDAFKRLFEAAKPLKSAAAEPIELDFGAHAEGLYRSDLPGHDEHDVFNNWCWGAGQYYVFTCNPHLFQEASLGPSAVLFIRGWYETDTRTKLDEALRDAWPCVLIDNTGGETQEYARAMDGILEEAGRHVGKSGSELREALHKKAVRITEHARKGQAQTTNDSHITLASTLRLIDHHCELPWLLTDRVVRVNPLQVRLPLPHCTPYTATRTVHCHCTVQG